MDFAQVVNNVVVRVIVAEPDVLDSLGLEGEFFNVADYDVPVGIGYLYHSDAGPISPHPSLSVSAEQVRVGETVTVTVIYADHPLVTVPEFSVIEIDGEPQEVKANGFTASLEYEAEEPGLLTFNAYDKGYTIKVVE